MQTSFPEQAIFYYISAKYSDAISGYTELFGNTMELDIYIPSLRIGIEYDGKAWHHSLKVINREKKKYAICQLHEVKLIRIKESQNDTDVDSCDILFYTKESLDKTIEQLRTHLSLPEINTEKDRQAIQDNYFSSLRGKTLETDYPELLDEWNYNKNGSLTPSMFRPKSTDKVWWKCKHGHEYQSTVAHRTEGKGCPFCANQKVWPGFNDLATVNPEVASEWDYEKNGMLTPNMITAHSGQNIWWRCRRGHSWIAKPLHREKSGCPYCGGKKVLKGFNDFETFNPAAAAEWDYEKNGSKRPSDYTRGSNVIVHWICNECGLGWKASIYSRDKGSGCPICSKKRGGQKLWKSVRCIETGRVYNSIKQAAQDMGLDRRAISNCVNGRRKTTGKYHWEYCSQKDEEEKSN